MKPLASSLGPLGPRRFAPPSGGGGGGTLPTTDLLARWVADFYSGGVAADQSGNGCDATQASSSLQPARISGAVGGHAALEFDGADDYLDATLSITGGTLTAYAVLEITSGSGAYARVLSLGAPGNRDEIDTRYTSCILREATNAELASFRNGGELSRAGLAYSTWAVVTSRFDGANHVLRVNGSAGTPVSSSGSFAISAARLGSNLFTGDGLFAGRLAEVALYDAAHSDADCASNEAILAALYSL